MVVKSFTTRAQAGLERLEPRVLLDGTGLGQIVSIDSLDEPSQVVVVSTSDSPSAQVINRRLFYNDSYYDGNDPSANPDDDNAIASDKHALMPGNTASFDNYSSYSNGINGIFIDVLGLPAGTLTADNFVFRVGNGNPLDSWERLHTERPVDVSIRHDAGVQESDRITLIFENQAVKNQWLEVTVLSSDQTGLIHDDVFYFGNAIGETGSQSAASAKNGVSDAKVGLFDLIAVRDGFKSIDAEEGTTNRYDFNRDSLVNVLDIIILRENATSAQTALQLIDIPDRPTGQIEGRKWRDDNGNGQRDAEEPGLPGVTIYLDVNFNGVLDDDEPQTLTMKDNPETDFDEAGLYRFTGLTAGDYVVREVVPDGFVQTFPEPVARLGDVTATRVGPSAAHGFDATLATAHGTDSSVQADVDVTFEVAWNTVCSGLLSSLTSHHMSGDAIHVDLYGRTHSGPCILVVPEPEQQVVGIEGVPAGSYKLTATLHESKLHVLPFDLDVSNDELLPVVDLTADAEIIRPLFVDTWELSAKLTVETPGGHRVTLDPNEVIDGVDFGNQPVKPGSVHGTKWEDTNRNGQRDANEPGLPGVVIYSDVNRNGVLDNNEPRTRTMEDDQTTDFDESGMYWLENLRPGRHVIREVVPDGFVQTFPPRFSFDPIPLDPAINEEVIFEGEITPLEPVFADNVIKPIPGSGAHFVLLEPGDEIRGLDFGNHKIRPASVHGVKWNDVNGNGQRDADEPGLPGVTIYSDLNGNRVLDNNEPQTKSMEDDPVTDFDESGLYWLQGLNPGHHVVREVVPDGFMQTFPRGPVPVLSDAAVPIVLWPGAHSLFLNSGDSVDGIDFGNQEIKPGSVHGVKWEDTNGNRQRDANEPGLPGVVIYSDLNFNGQPDANEPRTVSMEDVPETDFDESGLYWLDGLKPGYHVIREVVPEGFEQTFPAFPVPQPFTDPAGLTIYAPGAHVVFVPSGGGVDEIDFGNREIKPGSIHGLKWQDVNGNGERDINEPGLAGVTIYLDMNGNGVFDDDEPNVLTMEDDPITDFDETGRYWITGLPAGDYLVREVVPDGFEQTFPGPLARLGGVTATRVAPSAAHGLDAILASAHGPTPSSETDVDVTFEVAWNTVCSSLLPSLTSHEVSGDAIHVELFGRTFNHACIELVPTPQQHVVGLEDVPAGTYELTATLHESSLLIVPLDDVAQISDELLPIVNLEAEFDAIKPIFKPTWELKAKLRVEAPGGHRVWLGQGETADGINFGNLPTEPGSVHGVKWLDANGDGQRDTNEAGLPGVVIYSDVNRNGVLDANEARTRTMEDDPSTSLDEAGRYWLENLKPGTHFIREVVPDGFEQTFPRTPIVLAGDVATGDDTSLVAFPRPAAHVLFVSSGEVIDGVDFGNHEIKPGSIHGVKWLDRNGDGQRSSDEPGLPGVTIYSDVNLNGRLDVNEPQAVTMEDDPNTAVDETGRYWLEGLRSGLHLVREVVPDGFIQTFPDVLLCKAIFCTGRAHIISLEPGDVVEGVNFGNQEIVTGSIHGVKWEDVNGNGQRDSDEPGLPGVMIYVDLNHNGVLDNNEPRTLTMEDDPDTNSDESGMYWLDELKPGNYTVREVVPDGFRQTFPLSFDTTPGDASNLNDEVISSFATVSPSQIDVILAAGEVLTTDVSMTVHPLCIRAFNVDVVASDPQAMVANHTGVLLNGCGGDTSKFEVSLTGMGVPQSYDLQFVDADFGGVLATIPVVIAVPGSGGAHRVSIEPGDVVERINFGNQRTGPGSVHGTKWEDRNGNSERDPDEPGLPGVVIYSDVNRNGVLDANEPRARTMQDDPDTQFDEAGRYWLEGLKPGTHVIREVVPDGFRQTFPLSPILLASEVKDDGTLISPVPFPRPGAHVLNVRPGEGIDGVDFGNQKIKPGSIHGVKWLDRNGDGQRDANEPGLPGVVIYSDLNFNGMLDNNEPRAVTMDDNPDTAVDEAGRYWLEKLRPGTHVVREVVPDGFVQTFPRRPIFVVTNGNSDRPLILPPDAHLVVLESGGVVEGIDFGNQRDSGSIHGVKWLDRNGDGQRSNDEPGLAGVLVYSDLNHNGVLDDAEPRTVTMRDIPETDFDEGGMYWLNDLPTGRHLIREVVPDGFIQTFPLRLDPATVEPSNEVSNAFATVSPSQIDTILAAGEVLTTDVSWAFHPLCVRPFIVDVVASDPQAMVANHTGVLVNGCGGDLSTFEVSLTGTGVPQSYDLQFVDAEFGGVLATIPVSISLPGSSDAHSVILEPGDVVDGIDFGNQRDSGSIHGTKWEDTNGNGQRDADEPGLAGVLIYSDLNHNGVLDDAEPRTVTMKDIPETDFDEGGMYWLENLPSGRHLIREVVPDGFRQTFPEPFDPTPDDSSNEVNNAFATVSPAQIATVLAAGEVLTTEVSMTVHPFCIRPYDVDVVASNPQAMVTNHTGVLVNGCGGDLSTFEVSLTGTGVPQSYDLQFVDAEFGGVLATISVSISLPGSGGAHGVILEPGDVVEGINFGNQRDSGSIHGTKWEDTNGNGQRDANEPGLAGVVIYSDLNHNGRFDRNEPVTRTMQDDPNTDFDEGGMYWLEDLGPGRHLIREVVPDGFKQTFPVRLDLTPSDSTDELDNAVTTVSPSQIDTVLAAGEVLTKEVSMTIHPFCIRPYDVDVVASDPQAMVANHTGILVNGCGGDTSILEVSLTGTGVPQSYDLQFVDAEFGGVLATIPVSISLPGSGGAHHVILERGDVVEGIDFGNQRIVPGSVHGVKWEDLNGNSQRDPDEPGLAGVVIYSDLNHNGRFDRNEPVTRTMQDDPNTDFDETGRYWLEGLGQGTHVIREVVPDGFRQTFPLPFDTTSGDPSDLNDEIINSFATVAPFQISTVLADGEVLTTEVSMTIHPLCIRAFDVGVVASDPQAVLANHTGVLVNGCGGDTSKFEVSLTGTGVPQSYDLQFVDDEFGGVLATIPVSIAVPGSGGAHRVSIENGDVIEEIDFGNQRIGPSSVHGVKWEDRNGNAERDSGEPGLPGVVIYSDLNHNGLLEAGEPVTRTMQDDPNTDFDETGRYWLEGLKPGTHVIREVVPKGFQQTFPQSPILLAREVTSEGVIVSPIPFPRPGAHVLKIGPGEVIDDVDFGNQKIEPGSIHGVKWLDRNGDGQRGDNEPGLAGVTIYSDLNFNGMLDENEPHAVSMEDDSGTTVDETGRYWLEGLRPGTHVVREVVPDGFVQTFPRRPIFAVTSDLTAPIILPSDAHLVVLASGGKVDGIDFGNQKNEPGSIHGVTWVDTNGDGQRSDDEPGLPGVIVYSDLNFNGVMDQGEPRTVSMKDDPDTLINESGMYWLKNVKPGDHVIREVVPDGFVQTFPSIIASAALIDGGDSLIEWIPGGHFVSLLSGQQVDGIDFGNRRVKVDGGLDG